MHQNNTIKQRIEEHRYTIWPTKRAKYGIDKLVVEYNPATERVDLKVYYCENVCTVKDIDRGDILNSVESDALQRQVKRLNYYAIQNVHENSCKNDKDS